MDLRATGAIDACRVNEERTARANVRDAIFLLRGYQQRLCLSEGKLRDELMTQKNTSRLSAANFSF